MNNGAKNNTLASELSLQHPKKAKLISYPFDGQSHYELRLGRNSWKLPLVEVGNGTRIAYFDSLGEIILIKGGARILANEMKDCDIVLTSESKGIALAHEIASSLKHTRFIVCRKQVKSSMKNPIIVKYQPITSDKKLTLCLDSRTAKLLEGKKVGLIDDIVSTGATFDAMEKLVKKAHGKVQKRAALLLEGHTRPDILHLGVLPIFKK